MPETHTSAAEKILAVLDALAASAHAEPAGLTVAELGRAIEREKSVVSRQLKPLVELGLVERDPAGRHRLGWRLFSVAAQAGDQRLLMLAPPVMRKLARGLDERVHLSVRRDSSVLTVLTEGSGHAVQTVNWVGRLSPISCTSSGRALLFDHRAEELEGMFAAGVEPGAGPQAPATAAELIERVAAARERGYAIAVDEFEDGLAGVGAPVRDANGRIIAAINVSGPRYRLHDRLEDAGRHVSQATAYLSRAFAAPPPASASTDRIPVIPPPLQPGSHQQGHQPGAPQPAPSV